MRVTPTAAPVPVEPPPAPSSNRTAVGVGVGGAGFAIWLLDRLLLDGGEQAAAVLSKVGPVLGPVWASWPLIGLLAVLAWMAADKWRTYQATNATANAALNASVASVADGLTGLRTEVHDLRGALQTHASQTEAKIAGIADKVGGVERRVDKLERPRRVRRPKPAA